MAAVQGSQRSVSVADERTCPAESFRLTSASAALAPTCRWSNSARQPPWLGWKYSQRSLLCDIGSLLVGQRHFIWVKAL